MTVSAYDAHPFPIYNARYRVVFPILDADGDLVTAAGSLDSEASQDAGTFADCTNEATEIATSSGMYYLDLVAGELDTKVTALIVKSTGGKTTPIVLYPVRMEQLRTGTAQAGAASTITLDSGASAEDDFYNGCYVNITNNTPANAQGQARRIIDYVGSTKVATIEGAWGTNPSSSSTFEILVTAEWRFRMANVELWNNTSVPAEHTAGYPVVTVKDGTGTGEIDTASGAVVNVTNVTNLTNAPTAGDLTATMKASVNTEVVDGLNVDTYAEPGQATPSATATLAAKINYLYKAWRNKKTQTATTFSLFNDDAATVDQKATVSDDGTTTTVGEVATGP